MIYTPHPVPREIPLAPLSAEYLDLSLRTRFAQPVLDMTGGT